MSDSKNEQEAVKLLQSFKRDEGLITLKTKIHQPEFKATNQASPNHSSLPDNGSQVLQVKGPQ